MLISRGAFLFGVPGTPRRQSNPHYGSIITDAGGFGKGNRAASADREPLFFQASAPARPEEDPFSGFSSGN